MEYLKIIACSIAAAILYGIVHDLFTVHLCVQYFTVGHPQIFGGLTDPIALAFAWGVIATWWVGLPLGLALSFSAQAGRLPKIGYSELLLPVGLLLVALAVVSLTFGLQAYFFYGFGIGGANLSPAQRALPAAQGMDDQMFVAVGAAHAAAYLGGLCGGGLLCGGVVFVRYRRKRRQGIAQDAGPVAQDN